MRGDKEHDDGLAVDYLRPKLLRSGQIAAGRGAERKQSAWVGTSCSESNQ